MAILDNLSQGIKNEMDDSMGIIQLVCGEIEHRPFWAYVSMYPSTYEEYLAKVDSHENVNIEAYGVVIEKGWGDAPPQDVQNRMKEDFGADNNFQAELEKAALDVMREEFGTESEEGQ